MANDYFTEAGVPSTGAAGTSSVIRAEFTSVGDAFDKLPALSGNGGKIIAVNSGASALEAITTTGTGSGVRATSPTLVTPVLGVATATSVNKLTLTQPASGAVLTIADGKTLTASNTLTFTGTDGSTLAIGAGGTLGTGAFATIADYLSTATAASTYAPLVSPSFTTPTLGVATATSVNKVTITQPASSATLTIANGKALTVVNTISITATDGAAIVAGSGIISSVYEPTLTNTTNVSSSTTNASVMYSRVGDIITVSGEIELTASLAGATDIKISLPVASDFTQTYHLGGCGSNVYGDTFLIHADTTGNQARMAGYIATTGLQGVSFTFTYRVL